jgi:hypothetical protein
MSLLLYSRCDLTSPRDLIRNQIGVEEYSRTTKESTKVGKIINAIFQPNTKTKTKQTSSTATTATTATTPPPQPTLFHGTLPRTHFTPNTFQSLLLQHAYYVSEHNTAACRYLLFCHRQLGTFLINRASTMVKVDLNLPVAAFTTEGSRSGSGGRQHCTLLDGELAYQTLAGGRTDELIYFITDAIRIDGQDVHRLPYNERLAAVHARVLSPRKACTQPTMQAKLRKEKIRMKMKPIHHISECPHLLRLQERQDLKRKQNNNGGGGGSSGNSSSSSSSSSSNSSSKKQQDIKNGLYFTPLGAPYVTGQAEHVLKWQRVDDEEKVEEEEEEEDLDGLEDLEDLEFDMEEEDEDDEDDEDDGIKDDDGKDNDKNSGKKGPALQNMTTDDLYRIMAQTGQNIDRFTLPKEETTPTSLPTTTTTNNNNNNNNNTPTAQAATTTAAPPPPTLSTKEAQAMSNAHHIQVRLAAGLNPNIGNIDPTTSYMIGSEEMVQRSKQVPRAPGREIAYYQDINKSWPFYTSRDRGLALLSQLVQTCSVCLARNSELMQASAVNTKELEESGKDIYRNKPTFKRTRDAKEFGDAQFVTWSQEEYANLGLQRQYLKLKSYQRFTEAWSLLERADARGLFDDVLQRLKQTNYTTPLRIASVGGGPGFELYAVQQYFNVKTNRLLTMELTSMDYEKTWEEYARLMGFRFIHYDLKQGNLLHTLGKWDYCEDVCVVCGVV